MKNKKEIKKTEKKTDNLVRTLMPNHVQDYLASAEGNKQQFHSRELFKVGEDNEDVDLKTEIDDVELTHINALKWNNKFLESKGLKPLFKPVIENFMRLKFSRLRGSRKEFTEINKGQQQSEEPNPLNRNLTNMGGNIRR